MARSQWLGTAMPGTIDAFLPLVADTAEAGPNWHHHESNCQKWHHEPKHHYIDHDPHYNWGRKWIEDRHWYASLAALAAQLTRSCLQGLFSANGGFLRTATIGSWTAPINSLPSTAAVMSSTRECYHAVRVC